MQHSPMQMGRLIYLTGSLSSCCILQGYYWQCLKEVLETPSVPETNTTVPEKSPEPEVPEASPEPEVPETDATVLPNYAMCGGKGDGCDTKAGKKCADAMFPGHVCAKNYDCVRVRSNTVSIIGDVVALLLQ